MDKSKQNSVQRNESNEGAENESDKDNKQKTAVTMDHATVSVTERGVEKEVTNTEANTKRSPIEDGARVAEDKYDASIQLAETIVKKSVGEFLKFVEASVGEALNHTEAMVREGVFLECFGVAESRFERAMQSAESVVKKSIVDFLNFLVAKVEEAVHQNDITGKYNGKEHVRTVAKKSVADVMDFIETEVTKTVSHAEAIIKESSVELLVPSSDGKIEETVHHAETTAKKIVSGLLDFVEARIEDAVRHAETLVKECVVMECVGIAEGKYDEPIYHKESKVKKDVLECLESLETNIEKAMYHAEAIVTEGVVEDSVGIVKNSSEQNICQPVSILESFVDKNLNFAETRNFEECKAMAEYVPNAVKGKEKAASRVLTNIKVEQVVNHAEVIVLESVVQECVGFPKNSNEEAVHQTTALLKTTVDENLSFAEARVVEFLNDVIILRGIVEYVGKADSVPETVKALVAEGVERQSCAKVNVEQVLNHAEIVLESAVDESGGIAKISCGESKSILDKYVDENLNFVAIRVEKILNDVMGSHSIVEECLGKTESIPEPVKFVGRENIESNFPKVNTEQVVAHPENLGMAVVDAPYHIKAMAKNTKNDSVVDAGVEESVNYTEITTLKPGIEIYARISDAEVQDTPSHAESTAWDGTIDESVRLTESRIQQAVGLTENIIVENAIAVALVVAAAVSIQNQSVGYTKDDVQKTTEYTQDLSEAMISQVKALLLDTITDNKIESVHKPNIRKTDILETVSHVKSAPEMTFNNLKSGLVKAVHVSKAVGGDNKAVETVNYVNSIDRNLVDNTKVVDKTTIVRNVDPEEESASYVGGTVEGSADSGKSLSVESFGFSDSTVTDIEGCAKDILKPTRVEAGYYINMAAETNAVKTVHPVKNPSERAEKYILEKTVNDVKSSSWNAVGIPFDDDAETKGYSKVKAKAVHMDTEDHARAAAESNNSIAAVNVVKAEGHMKGPDEVTLSSIKEVVTNMVDSNCVIKKRIGIHEVEVVSHEDKVEESIGFGNSIIMETLPDHNLHTPLQFNLQLQLEATVSQVEAILLKAVEYAKNKSQKNSNFVNPVVEKRETITKTEISESAYRSDVGNAIVTSDKHLAFTPEDSYSHIPVRAEDTSGHSESTVEKIMDDGKFVQDADNQQQNVGESGCTVCSQEENQSRDSAEPVDESGRRVEVVVGLTTQLNILRELVVFPLLPGEEFERFKSGAPRGVLLYGRAGTGKTLVGRCLSSIFRQYGQKVMVLKMNCYDWVYENITTTTNLLKKMFEDAKSRQPSVIFLDDIHVLTPCRLTQNHFHKSIVSTLVTLMKDLGSNNRVVVIATTNHSVECLDVELLCPGTFERQIYLPLPHLEARKDILRLVFRNLKIKWSEEFIAEIADWTPGYSGAELERLCIYSQTMARLRLGVPATARRIQDEIQVQRADFVSAAKCLMQQPVQHIAMPTECNGAMFTASTCQPAICQMPTNTAPSQQMFPTINEPTKSSTSSGISTSPFSLPSSGCVKGLVVTMPSPPHSGTPIPQVLSTTSNAVMNTISTCELLNERLSSIASSDISPTVCETPVCETSRSTFGPPWVNIDIANAPLQPASVNSLPRTAGIHPSSDPTNNVKIHSARDFPTQSTPLISFSSDWVNNPVHSAPTPIAWSVSTAWCSLASISDNEKARLARDCIQPIVDSPQHIIGAPQPTTLTAIPSLESIKTASMIAASDSSLKDSIHTPSLKTSIQSSVLVSVHSSVKSSLPSDPTYSQVFITENSPEVQSSTEYSAVPSLQQVVAPDLSMKGSIDDTGLLVPSFSQPSKISVLPEYVQTTSPSLSPTEEFCSPSLDSLNDPTESDPTAQFLSEVTITLSSEQQEEELFTSSASTHPLAITSNPSLNHMNGTTPSPTPAFPTPFAWSRQPLPDFASATPFGLPRCLQVFTHPIFSTPGFPTAAVSLVPSSQQPISSSQYPAPFFNNAPMYTQTGPHFLTTAVPPVLPLPGFSNPISSSNPSFVQPDFMFSAPPNQNTLSVVDRLMTSLKSNMPNVRFEEPIILGSICPNFDYSTTPPTINERPWVPNNGHPRMSHLAPHGVTGKLDGSEICKLWETFDSIGGLEKQLNVLRKLIIYPFLPGKAFARFRNVGFRGVLIHGPPGTGKTMAVSVLENECWRHGVKVTCVRLSAKHHSNDHARCVVNFLQQMFETAKSRQPSIIVLEDIDVLANIKSNEYEPSVVSSFVALADSLGKRNRVALVGTTNRDVESLGGALFLPGRFERKVYFPLPSYEHRKDILRLTFRNKGACRLDESIICDVADWTAGCSGADLCHLCTVVLNSTISKNQNADGGPNVKIRRADFLRAILERMPAVPEPMASPGRPLSDVGSILLTTTRDRILKTIYSVFPQGMADLKKVAQNLRKECLVSNPRVLVIGGSGQGLSRYLAPAVLHSLSHLPIYRLDVCQNCPEHLLKKVFSTARSTTPSVIYLPYVNRCWDFLSDNSRDCLLDLIRELDYTVPLLIFATTNCSFDDLSNQVTELFMKPHGHIFNVTRTPSPLERRHLFKQLFSRVSAEAQNFEKPIVKKLLEATRGAPFKTLRRLMHSIHRRIKCHNYQMTRGLFEQLKCLIAIFEKNKFGFVAPEQLVKKIRQSEAENHCRTQENSITTQNE